MRKYTGKYPNAIREVSGTFAPGIALVKTNNGGAYYIKAADTAGVMPKPGEDVFSYKFTRAQPMTFAFDEVGVHVLRFHRLLDGYAIPFAEYPLIGKFPDIIKTTRKAFITDMAKQGILPRFQQ